MDIREMRRRISEVYDGLGWKKKVANMPDMQVYAIYKEFEKSGKFRTERQLKSLRSSDERQLQALKKVYEPKNDCHQVTIDEFFGDLVTKNMENMDNKEEK